MELARELRRTCGSKAVEQKPHFLEVGCGAGRVVSAFQLAGWNAAGIDLNSEAVRTARRRGLDVRDAALSDIVPNSIHLVAAFHLLEHLHSPRLFLQQCSEVLVPRGWLLLEVPDYGGRQSQTMRSDWPNLYPDTHLYQFTIESLRKYLTMSGFAVQKIRRLGGKGPLEDFRRIPNSKGFPGITGIRDSIPEIKKRIFDLRRFIWWFPGIRKATRLLFWHFLGYGENLRVLARKNY
jgi:SAM-dependent methyltransferase